MRSLVFAFVFALGCNKVDSRPFVQRTIPQPSSETPKPEVETAPMPHAPTGLSRSGTAKGSPRFED